MKKLTVEEASHYFTSKEQNLDLVNIKKDWKKILGYTLAPDGNGWENLTYITRRKKKIYFQGEGNYYVYILSNPTIPNILKIGFTGKHPETRAKEISRSTGVPKPYKVVWAFKCHDGHNLEREGHKELDYCRISSDREHFEITVEEAKNTILKLGKTYTNERY